MSNKCFFLAGIVAIIGAIEVIRRARRMQDVKAPIFLTMGSCVLLLVAGIILSQNYGIRNKKNTCIDR